MFRLFNYLDDFDHGWTRGFFWGFILGSLATALIILVVIL